MDKQVNEIEKNSYDRYTYRYVQRKKKQGLQRGVTVPELHYELDRPKKPRQLFLIAAILSCVLIAGFVASLVYFYIKTGVLSAIGEIFSHGVVGFSETEIAMTLGLSGLVGVLQIGLYFVIIVLMVLPIILFIYFYFFIRNAFSLSYCSNQELAKGHRVLNYIIKMCGILICVVIAFVLLAKYTNIMKGNYAWVFITILVISLVLLLPYIVLLIYSRVKANKWFATLDEEKQQDYLNQENAIRQINHRQYRDNHTFRR